MEAEYLSRFLYVAACSFERLLDGFALDLLQGEKRRDFTSEGGGTLVPKMFWKVLRANSLIRAEKNCTLDCTFELAHVAGPAIPGQKRKCRLRDPRDRLVVLAGESPQK